MYLVNGFPIVLLVMIESSFQVGFAPSAEYAKNFFIMRLLVSDGIMEVSCLSSGQCFVHIFTVVSIGAHETHQ